MRTLRILGAAALGLLVMTDSAQSQRGGAVRSGMRGAVVGDMVGGSEGVEKGAKIGAVTGATRTAINRENTTRTQAQSAPGYQSVPATNFNEAPPEVLGVPAATTEGKAGEEAIIKVNGKPLVGVTFPEDWKQKNGDITVSAVSKDGQAYAVFASIEDTDKQAGVKKIRERLEKHLTDIKFDEQAETKGGAIVVTGTGKTKKDVEVSFAVGLFEADAGKLVGAAFFVDSKIDDHYKETMRGICQTIRRAKEIN